MPSLTGSGIHIEQQRLPPMGDDLVRKSASVVPMLSSEWQASQDPDDRERQAGAVKYQYDGKVIPNPKLLGQWQAVGAVKSIDEFDPERRPHRSSARKSQRPSSMRRRA